MKTKGIIFSAPMVRALLAGRKTQTRRLLNPQPPEGLDADLLQVEGETRLRVTHGRVLLGKTIPYAVGDRLYVREAFFPRPGLPERLASPRYRATEDRPEWHRLWKPSIHMPRWASRLWLDVTEVRVQRLQDISESDAVAEGIEREEEYWRDYQMPATQVCVTPKGSYLSLWDSLHTEPGTTWSDNPWIVAVSFDVHQGNIDSA